MEGEAVVKAFFGQFRKIFHRLRRYFWEKLHLDDAVIRRYHGDLLAFFRESDLIDGHRVFATPGNHAKKKGQRSKNTKMSEETEWYHRNLHCDYNGNVRRMKHLVKNAVEKFLAILVKIKLKRTHPTIIGITGSFGKTTTKEAVYHVLRTKWKAYRNPKSLNTEIGLLLAVLEQPSGFSSPLKWGAILIRAIGNAFWSAHYDFLVLEYGADKPGDIQHLVKTVPPDIGIITHIAEVHQGNGQFENIEAVFEEKKHLVTCLKHHGIAILNLDDELLASLQGTLRARTYWFSHKKKADIRAEALEEDAGTFSATIHMNTQKIAATFNIPGSFHISAVLPALLCGTLQGVSIQEGVAALQRLALPPGRLSVIQGKNGATLIDSSYNASPQTVQQAITFLKNFPGKRRIAVLGNMNELGRYTENAHREIGAKLADWLDLLITVGDSARFIAAEALKKGFPKSRIRTLQTAEEAAIALSKLPLQKGDIVLFKGSQNKVRLERAVKKLMAHPEEANKLLCRQELPWKDIA